MSKIQKASEDLVNLFDEIRDQTTIPHWIMFELFNNSKQKELYKISKTNDVTEILTDGVNFTVVFNEEIFDGLPLDMQKMAIVECLAGVSVSDSDAISLKKTNVNTHTGVLQKYGHEPVIILHESIKSLFDQKKQKDDEEKAQTKAKRQKN